MESNAMSERILVVIDVPPLDGEPWASQAFAEAGMVEADISRIKQMVMDDPVAGQLLLDTFLQPDAQQALAPHYWNAFEALYGDQPRMGIYGAAWLQFAPKVDACIVDWSGLGQVSSKAAQTLTIEEIQQARDFEMKLGKEYIRARASVLSPETFLELPTGLDDQTRIARTLDFLRSLSLAE